MQFLKSDKALGNPPCSSDVTYLKNGLGPAHPSLRICLVKHKIGIRFAKCGIAVYIVQD